MIRTGEASSKIGNAGSDSAGAVERAGQWLVRFAAPERGLDAQDLTLALFGVACALAGPAASPGLREKGGALAERMSGLYAGPDSPGSRYFHAGGAIAALKAAAVGPASDPGWQAYRSRCLEAWAILRSSRRLEPAPSLLRTAEALAAAVEGRTLEACPRHFPLTSIQDFALLYAAGGEEISEVSEEVASLTAFGSCLLPSNEPQNDFLRGLLRFWAFCAVKDRDLDALCPLLRSLKYSGAGNCPEIGEGVRFLLNQAAPDGSFVSQRMAIHLRSLEAGGAFDVDREVTLRMTVATLWTLQEMARADSLLCPMRPPEAEGGQQARSTARRPETKRPVLAFQEAEDKALAWVERHFDLFNPLRHRDEKRVEYGVKALAELALTCSLTPARNRPAQRERYGRIAERVWSEAFQNAALQEMLLNSPATLPAFGLYGCLRRCGYEDLAYRRRLEDLLAGGYLQAAEHSPAVHLDLVHSVLQGELPWTGEQPESLFRRTLLASGPDLHLLTDLDAYSFTHTVFFMTGFRRGRSEWLSDPCRRYLTRALPLLAGYYVRRSNWDLAGELLTAWRLCGLPTTAEYDQCWRCLLAAQEEDGSYGGPGWPEAKPGADAQWHRFAGNYHTTLVFLMGVAVALEPDAADSQ